MCFQEGSLGGLDLRHGPVQPFLQPFVFHFRVIPAVLEYVGAHQHRREPQEARHDGGAEVVSFVKQAGVVFAGLMPTSIVQDTEKRFAQTWGADWRPGAISEEALGMAEKIAQVSKPKKYVPVTPELLHLAAKKPLLHSAGVPWDYAPTNGYPGRKLLRNAVEASPDGGEVCVECGRKAGECFVTVANYGGVPEPMRERLFEKYATHGKSNGQGLGGYLSRLVAQAHGGELCALRLDPDRTEVCLTLPAYKSI